MTTTEDPTELAPDAPLTDPLGIAERLRDELRKGAAERDRDRTFPHEQCAAFRASGLLGLMVPREHGGGLMPLGAVWDPAEGTRAFDPDVFEPPADGG